MQNFFRQFIPFVFIGFAIVAFAFGILLLAYLFLIGAFVGLILFTLNWVRRKFFPPKTIMQAKPRSSRIIDSNDWKKM